MIKDCATTKPPSTSRRSTCFLGCFGCSGEKMQPTEKVNSSSRRSWVSKWNFSFKKSTTKTVPFDHATVSRKSRSKNHVPAIANTTWEIQVVDEDVKLTKKPVILVEENHAPALSDEQNTRRKKWIDTVKRQNGSSRSRQKETKLEDSIAPTTATVAGLDLVPVKKSVTISHSIVSSSLKPKTHPTSPPPPPNGKKPPHAPPAGGEADEGALEKTSPLEGGFDSIIGMSILLMTLVIMVLWGKLCAIICTCAWFFIAPRLVAGGKHSAALTAEKGRVESHSNLDLESLEYKKKVVLEGLLQRNHRNVVGRRL